MMIASMGAVVMTGIRRLPSEFERLSLEKLKIYVYKLLELILIGCHWVSLIGTFDSVDNNHFGPNTTSNHIPSLSFYTCSVPRIMRINNNKQTNTTQMHAHSHKTSEHEKVWQIY